MKRRRMGMAVLALVSAVAVGCGTPMDEPVVEESPGQLGQGIFRWVCVDGSDPTCGTGVFPRAVALGSAFDLAFFPDEDLPEEITFYSIDSISPRRVEMEGDDFRVQGRGEVAMLATGDGYGIDYIVIEGLPIDELKLERGTSDDDDDAPTWGGHSLAQVGVDTLVEATPYHHNQRLAGALPYEWEVLTPDMVELVRSSGSSAFLHGLREGVARISVRAGDFTQIFEVMVAEAPPEPDATTGGEDTDGSGSDSGSDSGSGTEGDTELGSGSGTEGDTELGSGSGTEGDTEGSTTTGGGR